VQLDLNDNELEGEIPASYGHLSHLHRSVCLWVCVFVGLCVCGSVCMWVCVYVGLYLYVGFSVRGCIL